MQTAQRPVATRLPVEPLRPFPVDALDAAGQRRQSSLSAYQMSSSDFDITFLTPVLVSGSQHSAQQANTRAGSTRAPDVQQGRQVAPTDFGGWSEYFADVPPVLVVRVTPKLAEGFWTMSPAGLRIPQGVALPPIKHFKPGFSRLHALCGNVQATPIHPFTLEQRVSETDAIREGLYVFDPQSLGSHCKSVKLVLLQRDRLMAPSQTWRTFLANHIGQLTLISPATSLCAPHADDVINVPRLPFCHPPSWNDEVFASHRRVVVDWCTSLQRTSCGTHTVQDVREAMAIRNRTGRGPPTAWIG